LEAYALLEDLGIGTIFEFFHSSGITPLMTEKLKSVVREGAMTDAIHFSILAAIQSGPDAYWYPRLAEIPQSPPQNRGDQEGIGQDVLASGQYLKYQGGFRSIKATGEKLVQH